MMQLLTSSQKEQFLFLAERLSPENLSCDGELSEYHARQREAILLRKWGVLEQEVGRRISEEELYKYLKETKRGGGQNAE